MQTVTIEGLVQQPMSILCLGAHSDDIEIGCGGTLLRLIQANPGLSIHWIVFSAVGVRGQEAAASADAFLTGAKSRKVITREFQDGFFPYVGAQIKELFEELKRTISPDLILTHYRHDLHQDHRLICELTWNTFRDHLILEYEVPKYDGDLGAPNCFVPLDESTVRRKTSYLMKHFASQAQKRWFSEETFLALMRLRGIEAGVPGGYAEAFYGRKVVLLGV